MHAFSRAAYTVPAMKFFLHLYHKKTGISSGSTSLSLPENIPFMLSAKTGCICRKLFMPFLLQSGVFPIVLHCSGVPDGRIFCSVIVFTWRKRDPRVLCFRVDRVLICLVDLNR